MAGWGHGMDWCCRASLDAIHLATALSIGDADMEVITYDTRFAAAARANGLTVIQPGRPARSA